jgi:hypothetical protein
MKKIILGLALAFLMACSINASAQTTHRVRFYYYPSSNVYYNVSAGDYWYYDDGTTNWVEAKTLPTTITVVKSPHYTVYYKDHDVWRDNATHQQKYKVKKNGTLKPKN